MRSLSTSALGQPSETKLTFGARAAGRPAFGFSMRQGLAERGRGRKRLARGEALRAGMALAVAADIGARDRAVLQ
jgi:hypothetical protein